MNYAHEFEDGWHLVDGATGDIDAKVYATKEEAESQLQHTLGDPE